MESAVLGCQPVEISSPAYFAGDKLAEKVSEPVNSSMWV